MEIILLEKIQNLGEIGDLVNVRNGYARNYLIPQKKAMMATAAAKAEVEERKRQLAEEEQKRLDEARSRAEQATREISLSRLFQYFARKSASGFPFPRCDARISFPFSPNAKSASTIFTFRLSGAVLISSATSSLSFFSPLSPIFTKPFAPATQSGFSPDANLLE